LAILPCFVAILLYYLCVFPLTLTQYYFMAQWLLFMSRLPVIVGFGGFNAAGRSSFHQSYQRMIFDSLSPAKREETLLGLATMMGRVEYVDGYYQDPAGKRLSTAEVADTYEQDILENTLIRRIGKQFFDVENIPTHHKVAVSAMSDSSIRFELTKRQLPKPIPPSWQITDIDDKRVEVFIDEGNESVKLATSYISAVQSAGQLPDGFDPAALYTSRFHPRGLQLAIIGASDAINSMGIPWETVLEHLAPDEVGVYATSIMSQLDHHGLGGLLQARLKAERVTTKQLALGLNSMPADFINAYVLGNMGSTASISGACASFLYNLRAGMEDIRSGRCRVVIVGSSEAPITPEIIDGYATMSALATDEKLCKLDNVDTPDYRRPSRPFGENCGFTLGESTQQVVLMDDALAMELGANIHGAVAEVFVNADGHKKSISAPGPGNYLTLAKAVAAAKNMLGDEAVRERSFIQAHGSSTPQNRITESEIFDRVAAAFGIKRWPLAAVKSYVGHSLAPASGDQLINALGVFAQGIIPGIKTLDKVADDVLQDRLQISNKDMPCEQTPDIAFLNSKGFGGNNASAMIISPQQTKIMLKKRYGVKAIAAYHQRNQIVDAAANAYNTSALQGDFQVRYHFGRNMVDDKEIELTKDKISVPGFGVSIDLRSENLYKDMLE
jgi:acetoacetyl-[acyl-carrier protein] synthase